MTYDYVIGMDVGKYFHHACVLDTHGNQILSKRVNQHEQPLRKLFSQYAGKGTNTSAAVYQPNNIGRLTVAVAQDIGINVLYLPGLAMRQLSRIHAGNSKTDVCHAYIIGYAGRNLPKSLRSVDRIEEAFIQPKALNRKWILRLLAKYGGPTKIKRLGKTRFNTFARKHRARNPEPITDTMFITITEQSVQIAGAEYAELGVAMSVKEALLKLESRKEIEAQVIELSQEIPQTQLLLSMPGIGPRTATHLLMTVGDMSDFPTAGLLASYAGLSPRTNQSGTSIMSNSLNRAGNKKLKNTLWQSSFASTRFHERSR
ncbi:transposase [Corynebacterium ammoniagenes DSM 20306]|uniref:Transposase, IS116/IS110/IS902 family n=1 Tax=Corynebacterium ammoniagenes DSM 20306 TaxID=649754 RepID=A0ABP2I9Y9_CORAM|nr:transposase [Corynebacterium ammoniagenes DSM 20306]AQS73283.1 IS110 family transposase [Corynebacterium ammoniagenes]EFG80245.1 transposase, IS116/IS110/IS902 family [Corynebacterium ammoniagenes DSM 20306]